MVRVIHTFLNAKKTWKLNLRVLRFYLKVIINPIYSIKSHNASINLNTIMIQRLDSRLFVHFLVHNAHSISMFVIFAINRYSDQIKMIQELNEKLLDMTMQVLQINCWAVWTPITVWLCLTLGDHPQSTSTLRWREGVLTTYPTKAIRFSIHKVSHQRGPKIGKIVDVIYGWSLTRMLKSIVSLKSRTIVR